MCTMVRAVAVAAALALVGCAHFPLRTELSCPRKHGPPWLEYQSPHFDLFSDLPSYDAIGLVAQLERTYRLFLDVSGWRFPDHGEPAGRMRLVVFERMEDYGAVAPPRTDGFFVQRSVDGAPLIAFTTSGPNTWRAVFLHELTHRLLHHHVANAPLWLHEGLAEFYSTFDVGDGTSIVVGRPPPIVGARPPAPVADLLEWHSESGLPDSVLGPLYIGAWFLVDALMTGKREQLGDALRRLAAGEPEEQAFSESFGPQFVGELDALQRAQARRQDFSVWRSHVPLQTVDDDVQLQRPLDDGEVHLVWARALPPASPLFARQLALAEQHGGVTSELLFVRGQYHVRRGELAAAAADLAAAVAARPDDERDRVALAQVHAAALKTDASPAARQAFERDLEWLDGHARSPEGLVLLALREAEQGRLTQGRARVARALELDPTSVLGCATLSAIAEQQGDIDGAFTYAERALQLAPAGADMKDTLARLDKMRKLRALRERRIDSARP